MTTAMVIHSTGGSGAKWEACSIWHVATHHPAQWEYSTPLEAFCDAGSGPDKCNPQDPASGHQNWTERESASTRGDSPKQRLPDETAFDRAFQSDPGAAVARLVIRVIRAQDRQPSEMATADLSYEATRLLFRKLVGCTPAEQRLIFRAMMCFADPGDVLSVALNEYRLYGSESRLSLAAGLLATFGRKAFPTLRSLVQFAPEQCQPFVTTITRLNAVPEEERANLLAKLARSTDPGIRMAVVDELCNISLAAARPILTNLVTDEVEEVSDAAKYQLGM